MSAHADKTLHRKIYNINDTDTSSPYPFFKNVIFVHEFMCEFAKEFFTNFVHEFMCEFAKKFFTNFVHEFV